MVAEKYICKKQITIIININIIQCMPEIHVKVVHSCVLITPRALRSYPSEEEYMAAV